METTPPRMTTIEDVGGRLIGFGVGRSRSTGQMKWIAICQMQEGRKEIVDILPEGVYMPFVREKMRA